MFNDVFPGDVWFRRSLITAGEVWKRTRRLKPGLRPRRAASDTIEAYERAILPAQPEHLIKLAELFDVPRSYFVQ